jgi:hypothetical protein
MDELDEPCLAGYRTYTACRNLAQSIRRRVCVRCEAQRTRQEHAGQTTVQGRKKHHEQAV